MVVCGAVGVISYAKNPNKIMENMKSSKNPETENRIMQNIKQSTKSEIKNPESVKTSL